MSQVLSQLLEFGVFNAPDLLTRSSCASYSITLHVPFWIHYSVSGIGTELLWASCDSIFPRFVRDWDVPWMYVLSDLYPYLLIVFWQ